MVVSCKVVNCIFFHEKCFLNRFFKQKILVFCILLFLSSWENYRGKQCAMYNGFSFVAKYFVVQKFNEGIQSIQSHLLH